MQRTHATIQLNVSQDILYGPAKGAKDSIQPVMAMKIR
jgi:hypothetical protein